MKLSERLSQLHSYYKDSHSVWDIGCDHGQLGLSFGEVETVEELYLVDPSVKVITKLKKTVAAYITKKSLKISVLERRGQEVMLNSNSKTIYIAGMGGKEIKEILIHLETQLSPRDQIVISPHRKILELRKYLHHSSFRLQDEVVLFENGHYYQIMALTFGGSGEVVTSYGSSLFLKGVGSEYKAHQIEHFKQHKDRESVAYFAYLATF